MHFFTKILRKDGNLFIVFEGKNNAFGEEKLVDAKDFFEKVKNSTISLLIFIGNSVNLLK